MLEQRWEQTSLERVRLTFRHVFQNRWLENIDAGVDRIACDLIGARLLDESLNPTFRTRFNKTVSRWILHACQNDGRNRTLLTMMRDNRSEIDVRQHISVEHDSSGIDMLFGIFECSTSSQG